MKSVIVCDEVIHIFDGEGVEKGMTLYVAEMTERAAQNVSLLATLYREVIGIEDGIKVGTYLQKALQDGTLDTAGLLEYNKDVGLLFTLQRKPPIDPVEFFEQFDVTHFISDYYITVEG